MTSDDLNALVNAPLTLASAPTIPWDLTIPIGVVATLLSLVCWAVFIRGIVRLVTMLQLAEPDHTRANHPWRRLWNLLKEFIAHTRLIRKRRTVAISHWFVMIGFLLGAFILLEAYIQMFNPASGWTFHEETWWRGLVEFIGITTILGGFYLTGTRINNNPHLGHNKRSSRFYKSNMGAAYFVDAVVILEGIGMLAVKAGQLATFPALGGGDPHVDWVTYWVAKVLPASPLMVSLFAVVKLLIAMLWLLLVGLNLKWGVAWHRFGAFFNIFLKREWDGWTALRAIRPMRSGDKTLTMENVDPDKDLLGVGRIQDFTWKDWLDFSVCTECGRCQDLCPAWNTGKPLNPKLVATGLRDVAQDSAPYLTAARKAGFVDPDTGRVDHDAFPRLIDLLPAKPAGNRAHQRAELQRLSQPLIGLAPTAPEAKQHPERIGLLDEDALWACTTCGACVDQCPLDLELVDHVINLRRHQVLAADQYPPELASLFRNLESKGNPWGQSPTARETWIDELERETGWRVPVWGKDVHDFAGEGMEYLFWVGCAGAYEDRAKEATKATALLLHLGGVKFCVLGNQETCTGDSARRAGNEFLFQEMAARNTELLESVFGESPNRKIIATCAHCFNTLGNEYPQPYTVIHHSVVLNQLVNRRRLVPTTPVEGITTYHDPCYLGRHNHFYSQPRELVESSGTQVKEMGHTREQAFCCGAGGAHFWMEEKHGTRINLMRVDEALQTGATTIATACPFCTVMMSDGVKQRMTESESRLVAAQAKRTRVADISVLLLESVRRGDALPQPLVPIPVGDIDVDEEMDGLDLPNAVPAEEAATVDDYTSTLHETEQEADRAAAAEKEAVDDVLAELEEEAVIDDASLLDAGLVTVSLQTAGLPLLGLIERADGVPTAQAPGPEPVAILPSSLATYQAEQQQLEKERKAEKEKAAQRKERVERAGQSAPVTGKPLEEKDDDTNSAAEPTVPRDSSGNELNMDVPGLPLVGMIARTDGVPAALPPLVGDPAETGDTAAPTTPAALLVYEDGVDVGAVTSHATAPDVAEDQRLSVPGLPLRAGVHAPLDFSRPLADTPVPHDTDASTIDANATDASTNDVNTIDTNATDASTETHTDGPTDASTGMTTGVSLRPGVAAPTDFSATGSADGEIVDSADADRSANKVQQEGVSIRPGVVAPRDFSASS